MFLYFLFALLFPLSLCSSLQDFEGFEEEIVYRHLEIEMQKEIWKPFIAKENLKHSAFLLDFWSIFEEGHLELQQEGAGGSYILYDLLNHPRFVIKPTDEDIYCLRNPKQFSTPFMDLEHRVKRSIPLYRSAQTSALCYELAILAGLENTTPQTVLSIISHPQFFYPPEEDFLPHSFEKLCSIQAYLSETKSLKTALEELLPLGLEEEELEKQFDQQDFEDVNVLLWLTYDNDAHPQNFRVRLKNEELQPSVYGITKIDNSLSFPEENRDFFNILMHLPNAFKPLSERTKYQIASLPLEKIEETILQYGLGSSLPAFRERIDILQKLIEKKEITYYECNIRLCLLSSIQEIGLALEDTPLETLERLLFSNSYLNLPF
jgi:hypothetical protein